jgi:hypothetical protein
LQLCVALPWVAHEFCADQWEVQAKQNTVTELTALRAAGLSGRTL